MEGLYGTYHLLREPETTIDQSYIDLSFFVFFCSALFLACQICQFGLNVNQGKASIYKSPQSKIAQIAKLIP